jgi:hypothetical protein
MIRFSRWLLSLHVCRSLGWMPKRRVSWVRKSQLGFTTHEVREVPTGKPVMAFGGASGSLPEVRLFDGSGSLVRSFLTEYCRNGEVNCIANSDGNSAMFSQKCDPSAVQDSR